MTAELRNRSTSFRIRRCWKTHTRTSSTCARSVPVTPLPITGVVAVSRVGRGYGRLPDPDTFSSCNSVVGPFASFPVPLEGDDIGGIIERYLGSAPDERAHGHHWYDRRHPRAGRCSLRLITPKRLKENEAFMGRLADRQVDELIARGPCEFIGAYAQPFRDARRRRPSRRPPKRSTNAPGTVFGLSAQSRRARQRSERTWRRTPSGWLDDYFATYVQETPRRTARRRPQPTWRLAKYPDGSTPDVTAVVRTATFLFAAGQETTARLLATSLKVPLRSIRSSKNELRAHHETHPGVRRRGAAHREPGESRLPSRPPRRPTDRRRRDRARGPPVMLLKRCPPNRDSVHFRVARRTPPRPPEHPGALAFGAGAHSCPGGPLARAEPASAIERNPRPHAGRPPVGRTTTAPRGRPPVRYNRRGSCRGLHALHIESRQPSPARRSTSIARSPVRSAGDDRRGSRLRPDDHPRGRPESHWSGSRCQSATRRSST